MHWRAQLTLRLCLYIEMLLMYKQGAASYDLLQVTGKHCSLKVVTTGSTLLVHQQHSVVHTEPHCTSVLQARDDEVLIRSAKVPKEHLLVYKCSVTLHFLAT